MQISGNQLEKDEIQGVRVPSVFTATLLLFEFKGCSLSDCNAIDAKYYRGNKELGQVGGDDIVQRLSVLGFRKWPL